MRTADGSVLTVPHTIVGRAPSGQAWLTTVSGAPAGDTAVSPDAQGPAGPQGLRWRDGSLTASEWAHGVAVAVGRITSGTLRKVVLARDVATVAVSVAGADGKPVPHATVVLIPDSVTSTRQLARDAVHGTTDQHGAYTSPPLIPGKYRVMATAQAIRWSVPDDLERVLPMLVQAATVEVAPNGSAQVAVSTVTIY